MTQVEDYGETIIPLTSFVTQNVPLDADRFNYPMGKLRIAST